MSEFHRGVRVRFTAAFAKTHRKYKDMDWTTRQGTVAREPRIGSPCIGVTWDGTKSVATEPKGALEVVR